MQDYGRAKEQLLEEELQALSNISNILVGHDNFEERVTLVLQELIPVLEADNASFMASNESEQGLGLLKYAEIKADDALKTIPMVVTTSQSKENILRSYNLDANCYVTKPIGLDQFIKVIHAVESFWLTVVTLPPLRNHA